MTDKVEVDEYEALGEDLFMQSVVIENARLYWKKHKLCRCGVLILRSEGECWRCRSEEDYLDKFRRAIMGR